MPKKWSASDFTAEPPRPHIKITAARLHLRSCGPQYKYVCADRGSGSRGYGYTAEHAYAAWLKNWTRRRNWYVGIEERARAHLAMLEATNKERRTYFASRDKKLRLVASGLDGFMPVEDES